MKKFISLVLIFTVLFASCNDPYDDTDIRNDIEDLRGRVAVLEKLCREINSNISAMQTILSAVQNNDYITAVTPIVEDGVVIGYTINFTKSAPVTIYHGKNGQDGEDGKDGYTPVISVRMDEDGTYYWTLDGDWLLDENGNKVKAVGTDGKDGQDGADGKDGEDGINGKDGQDGADGKDGEDGINGKDGQDGITPQLKIENGYWYISYDNGITWTILDKATGEDGTDGKDGQDGTNGKDGANGDSFFKSVTQDDEYVYFTLADGTVFTIPKEAELSISFNESDLVVMHPNSTREISYTIKSSAKQVTVELTSSADIKAKVVTGSSDGKSGKIVINTGSSIDEYSKVLVFVSDGKKVIMRSLSFEQSGIEINSSNRYSIPAAGALIPIDFFSNMDCEVFIPSSASDWLSVAPETRSMTAKSATIQVEPNMTFQARTSTIKIMTYDSKLSVDIKMEQDCYSRYTVTTPRSEGWLTEDLFTVFPGITQNCRFSYLGTEGNSSGEISTDLSLPSESQTTTIHSKEYYAFFPYKSETTITPEGVISTTFDAEQDYVENGWERKKEMMVSKGYGNGNELRFDFKPLTAYICLDLSVESFSSVKTIETLSITSNNGEALAGTANISMTPTDVVSCQVSGSSTINMNGVKGILLNDKGQEPTKFYFVVPAGNLSKGLTICLTDTYAKELMPHKYVINENINLSPGEVYTIPHTFNITYYFPIDDNIYR